MRLAVLLPVLQKKETGGAGTGFGVQELDKNIKTLSHPQTGLTIDSSNRSMFDATASQKEGIISRSTLGSKGDFRGLISK